MACPFAAAATLGGIFVGSKLLLFEDKYRVLMWLGFLVALSGWLLYVLLDRALWLRIVMEVQSGALVLGMVARVVYLVRVQRKSLEIPVFLRRFLLHLRPFALHPLTLTFKGLLLMLILADALRLIAVPSIIMLASAALLAGWLAGLIMRHTRSAADVSVETESRMHSSVGA
jgi:hypothetical protein